MENAAARRIGTIFVHVVGSSQDSKIKKESCSARLESKTLEQERKKGSFSVSKLTDILNGGEHITKLKEEAVLMIERDSILNDGYQKYDYSRPEARQKCTEKFIRAWEIIKDKPEDFKHVFIWMLDMYDRSVGMRWFVHWGLFINTINTHGTETQQRKWIPLAENYKIFGCFGMTELGHSSFLRGLETTATFDRDSDQFIMLSPTITATKWWIGVAGQIATHAIIFADLRVNNQSYGIQLFIVPLRDPESGQPLPGVSVGDLGPKMGRAGLDNGWIQLTNVRIPRENMLMKWAQLSKEGVFSEPPNAQLAYGSLITERVGAVRATTDLVDQAITVAVRYGTIRRQGEGDPQILDFQGFQYNLMPILAGSFATHFTYQRIGKIYLTMQTNMKSGNSENLLKILPDIHATSAGLKAYVTWWGTEALEVCRRSLGGHGYHSYSAVPSLIDDFGVMTTGGGDNIVMSQQTARYLMKVYRNAVENKKKLGDSVQYPFEEITLTNTYLGKINEQLKPKNSNGQDLQKIEVMKDAFEFLAVRLIDHAAKQLQESLVSGKSITDSWNENMIDLIEGSKIHIYNYIFESFVQGINLTSDEHIKEVLTKLCQLYGLKIMDSYAAQLLQFNYINSDQVNEIKKKLKVLCKEIREEAVSLVDALNIPDLVLNSPIGRKDGNIYEEYLKAVQESRGGRQLAPYWNSLIKPLTTRK